MTTPVLNDTQLANANIIVRTVIDLEGRWYDAVCAVACAMQESSLTNLPAGDKDSVGLFQQRPSQGWGTAAQCADPVYATTAFCVGTPNTAHGLFGISNRYNIPLTEAVQEVQLSAFPDAYAQWQELAEQLATAATAGAVVIGPPVPVSWIPAFSYTPGRPEGLDFIVVHDVESNLAAGLARDVAVNWFATAAAQTSAHAIVGPDAIVEQVKPMDTAWHCGNGNQRGYGVEQTGFASFTRAQWTTATAMLQMDNYAWWCAHIAVQYDIPARWLTDAQLATPGQKGFCTHSDVTRVLKGTTHTDPGTGYPRDLLMAKVAALLNPVALDSFEAIMAFYASKAEFEAMLKSLVQTTVHAVLASDSVVGAAKFGPNFQAGVSSGTDKSATATAVAAIKTKLGA